MFYFLIFCVIVFNLSSSCQHESLSQTCCFPERQCIVLLHKREPARTHKTRCILGYFALFRMLNHTYSQWWLHRLNSMQNLSFVVVFGISSVCNGLTWQLDFTEAQKNHSMPPISRALKMHYVLRFHVSLVTKVQPFLLLTKSCRLMHCFFAVPKGRLY